MDCKKLLISLFATILYSSVCFAVDDKVILIGGSPTTAAYDIEIISLSGESCPKPPPYPTNAYAMMAVEDNGQLMCCGGRNPEQQWFKDCYVMSLDNIPGGWRNMPDMKQERYSAGHAMTSKGWWIAGGKYKSFLATTEYFKDGEWVEGPDLPLALEAPCVVNVNASHVILIGGRKDQSPTGLSNRVWMFEPETEIFTEMAPLGQERDVHSCVLNSGATDEIVVAGGFMIGTTEIYDIASNTWRSGPDLPRDLADTSMVSVNTLPTIFGGYSRDPDHTGYQDGIYQMQGLSWTKVNRRLDIPRGYAATARISRC